MKALPIQNWKSYVPDNNLESLRKTLTASLDPKLPANIEDARVTQSQVKATTDATFVAINQASVNLVRQSMVAGPSAVEAFESQHHRDQEAKTSVKQEKKKAKKQARARPDEMAIEMPAVKQEAKGSFGESSKKQKMVSVPPANTVEDLPIETLEQHNRRDDQLALFALNMKRIAKPINDIIINQPPATAVMAYCAKYQSEFPWFAPMHNLVASNESYDYPDVPAISRALLVDFLREPNPRMPFERPCFNLDREPLKHEIRVRCVAHRMSEERLGKGKGYRLRELTTLDTQTKVANAMMHGKDPSVHLGPIPELCYLCHLWTALRDCTNQRDKADERLRKDMTDEPQNNVVIINKFMVFIDKPGEYDRTKMLAGDKVSLGIWGPVPLFNEDNYVCNIRNGLRTFDETDNLLFRPTRVSLPLIESQSQSTSQRSNPTLRALASTTFLH